MKTKKLILGFLLVGMLCTGETNLPAQAPKESREEKKAEVVPITIKPLWQKKLPPFEALTHVADDPKQVASSEFWRKEFTEIQDFLAKNPRLILPPFFPVARGNQLLLSSYNGPISLSLVDDKID